MVKTDHLNNPEFEALKDVEGIDAQKLADAASGKSPDEGGEGNEGNEGGPKPGDEGDGGQRDPKPQGGDTGDPKPGDPRPGEGDPKPKDDEPTGQSARDEFLKEIFGDRFKTFDEAKQANITGTLDEVDSLRQTKTELEERLGKKPKTNFANDEVALFNEFVKETGVRNYEVFEKLNGADVANMDPMDALITQHILKHPHLAKKETQVRKLFERKYNVDPEEVDEDALEINKLEVEADGATATKALQELKGKLQIPEPTPEDDKPKELTPEEKTNLQNGWTGVGQEVSKALNKLKVPIKNGKEPLLDYEVSESEQKEIQDFVANYAVENQMELNETNVRTVSHMVYNQLMINKLPDIVHSVFEKARSLTEEDVHKMYENPSPSKNNDQPPATPAPDKTDADKLQDDIFDAEMEEYNK